MKKIIYYVASSIDGYIAGKNEDTSGFLPDGEGVQKYLSDLQAFETVIMGRKTYEFGYKFGLKPGHLAYPHMNHYIFSETLHFNSKHEKVHIKKMNIKEIDFIRNQSKTDIYLCGGGIFAGWLLDNEQIDILKLKVNPLILGGGIKIFGDSSKNYQLELMDSTPYEKGLLINTYTIKYL